MQKHLNGPQIVQGDLHCLLAPEPDARFFYYLLGTKSTSTLETGAYQHDLTPVDALTKSFTSRIGPEKFERIIPGCLVNQMQIEMIAGDPTIVWAASILGCTETKGTIGSPTFSSLDEFMWHQGTLSIGGSARTYIKALRVRIANNMSLDRMYAIKATDGDKLSRIEVGEMVVDGTLDLYFEDSTEYDRFLGTTDFPINAKFEGPLVGATKKYTFEIDIPKSIYPQDTTPHIERREPFRINAPFRAMYDTSSGYIVKVRFVNGESTIP